MSTRAVQEQKPESLATDVPADGISGSNQFVTFNSNGRAYGVDIMQVREIRSWSPMVEMPDQPHAACGVLDIRGEIIQVFDLSILLGAGAIEGTQEHVVLVLAIAGHTIGILVDSVSDIIDVSKKEMRQAPPNRAGGAGVVSGIAKCDDKIVAILDLEPMLGGMGV